MKAQKILWLLFPFALAIATGMYFTSCHDTATDDMQPDTETVATATGDNDANSMSNANTNNDDQVVTFRSCLCTAACPIDIRLLHLHKLQPFCRQIGSKAGFLTIGSMFFDISG